MSSGLPRPGVHFMMGNFACVEAAILAGCRFFAGYPITPSSEIFERACVRFPQVGGIAVEMEDEMASVAALIGASYAGAKAMTATSGPGFSLMMENIGLAFIMEAPIVIVNVQRAGPSTGIPTLIGQGDVMQARWGSHGDIETVVYSPSSVQEFFDLTIQAFNTAERLRTPVIVLTDQLVGLMWEKVVIPSPEEVKVVERKIMDARLLSTRLPFDYTVDVNPMPIVGTGCRVNIDSLTHDERGYPTTSQEISEKMLRYLLGKIRNHARELWLYKEFMIDDAEVVVVAYGSTARSALNAVKQARSRGIKAGLLQLITLWPFPSDVIEKVSQHVNALVVPEINFGQLVHPIREYAKCPILEVNWAPGSLIEPNVILDAVGVAAA
ncbi:2-oxoglutarate oxidoreductase subunit KorA [Candidatus Calditenuaceae archaeon HR02]|nr:2-oxoglutarate oxidoreductase subunit KorA [Candidatus Calditenuaceae archaeon HR02]